MPNLGFGGFLLLCWWCLIVPLLILLLIDSNFQPATIQVFCQTSQKKNVLGHHLQIMILFRNCWMKVNNVNSSVTVLLRIQLQKQNFYRNFYQKLFYINWPLVAVVAHEIRQQSPKAQGCRHSTGPPRNSDFLYLSCYMSCYTHRIHVCYIW